MLIVLRCHWLHKTKDNDHTPDATNDNHQKAVFHESKKQSGISDTLTNLHVKCEMPQAQAQVYIN